MKIVYVCVYALTIYLLFSIDYHYMDAIFLIYLGVAIVFGAGNVFRYILPDVLTLMKKRMFVENRHFLISLGNLRLQHGQRKSSGYDYFIVNSGIISISV